MIAVIESHPETPSVLEPGSCSSEGRFRNTGPGTVSYRDQRNTMPAATNKLFWWSFLEFAKVVK
jgi:hypothetical protein